MRWLTLLFLAASLQAQPIVFGAPRSLPMTGFAQPPDPGRLSLTGSGDGFFALYGTTMIRLDAGGRTLARTLVSSAADVAAVVPLGSDVLVAGRSSFLVDPESLTTRTSPIAVSTSAVASNGSTIVAVKKTP
ncbi:MAG TPA: hypothetical protein VI670_28010 [Thermoanaerobaculia bacterium]|jgi:hypothetical protein